VEESEDEDEDGRMVLGARSGLPGGAIPMFGAAALCPLPAGPASYDPWSGASG
jgi:hypothetical protein